MSFVVLLPVKPPARGKSRLDLAPGARTALATAFALDTAAACLATPSVTAVLVVTDDALFARAVGGLGCSAIPDGVTDDLNGSLRLAAAEAVRRWPGARPVALCGDLPALRPADLEAALAAVNGSPAAFVTDAAGTGTTLYSAATDFSPRYGPDSAALHADAGATPVPGELVSLRHDVDTLADLRDVVPLGLGPRTTLAAGQLGLLA
ncbi:2-phospho-L-lactate guanylyltransferase [Nocardioides sp.]|jgi:2-phospho-L-lactate guanylyltransferase|uniref:2-phospho-L-lactate guanylyltransferase n=1 Tax=Nocardioides sp. TaxID=35761 RepID=UPI002CC1D0D0|nr:2-phospho-L-lactate guanylyltransferase [Nocardioides sp.]HVX53086.1 2-phospho-L-lactate guanylyltransferase [Nocardioides sp.]